MGHHWFSFLAVVLLAGCSDSRHSYLIATGADGTSFKTIGTAIAQVWQRDMGVDIQPVSGPEYTGFTNVQRLVRGEVDFAVAQNDLSLDMSSGGNKTSSLRTVLPLFPELLFIIYRDSLNPTSLGNLIRGRKIGVGPRTSGTAIFLTRFLKSQGIDSTEYTLVHTSYADRTLSDSVDICCALTGFTNPSIDDMLTNKHGKLFSIDRYELAERGSSVDGFCLKYRGARPYVIPRNTYGTHPEEPILTVAIDALLVTRSDIDEYLVHDLVRTLLANQHSLSQSDPLLISMREKFDLSRLNFPLHAGVQRYLERNEPSYLERYSEVLGLVVSIVLALVGGISTFVQWNARRKKNRIDTYYAKLLEIEKGVEGTTDSPSIWAALKEIEDLRRHGYIQLMDEKLAADESFRIFITMAGEVAERLNHTAAQSSGQP